MRYEAVARVAHGPQAPRSDVVERLGPYRVADPYRWLEDAGDPRTASWLDEQRAMFAAAECTSPLLDTARYELGGLGSRLRGEFGSRDNTTELGYFADILAFFSHCLTGLTRTTPARGERIGEGRWTGDQEVEEALQPVWRRQDALKNPR